MDSLNNLIQSTWECIADNSLDMNKVVSDFKEILSTDILLDSDTIVQLVELAGCLDDTYLLLFILDGNFVKQAKDKLACFKFAYMIVSTDDMDCITKYFEICKITSEMAFDNNMCLLQAAAQTNNLNVMKYLWDTKMFKDIDNRTLEAAALSAGYYGDNQVLLFILDKHRENNQILSTKKILYIRHHLYTSYNDEMMTQFIEFVGDENPDREAWKLFPSSSDNFFTIDGIIFDE